METIKDVAIYLRKSRGDADDLDKHLLILTELADKYSWEYVVYQEIGSSDSISDREEFKRLIADVRNDLYDAVLVVDLDRLSRGSQQDQGFLTELFRNTDTKVITPTKVYDYNNEDQEIELELVSFIARFEYNLIKKRLHRGKKIGAKQGRFTNGSPPYPYFYNREKQKVEIDVEKLKVYNLIKSKFFEGISPYQIAFMLNRNHIPSPGGKTWSNNTVYRLLKNEFHLGKIIYGKTQGSGHKNKKTRPLKQKPRDEWIISEGEHTPVKTEEEHSKILIMLESRRTTPVAARRGKRILSGILKCKLCGRGASFYDRKNGESIKPCQYRTPTGEKCPNRGLKAEHIYNALNKELDKYRNELLKYNPEKTNQTQDLIDVKTLQLKKLQDSISKIQDMYEMGHIKREEYMRRWDKRNNEIQELANTIDELKDSKPPPKEAIKKIMQFQDIWDSKDFTSQQKNTLVKQIVKTIVYQRDSNNLFIDIEFL